MVSRYKSSGFFLRMSMEENTSVGMAMAFWKFQPIWQALSHFHDVALRLLIHLLQEKGLIEGA